MEHLWSTLAPAAAGVLIGSAAPWPLKALWRWLRGDAERADQREAEELARLTARCGDLEELVDLLRRALDKHLIRESAIKTAAELLIAMIEQVPHPTPPMLRIRDRAVGILEQARAQLDQINRTERGA